MLKLLIADDERIIRETLANIIDWRTFGIEVIGLCENGIEAYDMMLDETPDIVLTDIRMPGISGLELIERAYRAELPTQFIILSGFGEFEYAKQAMKYGVKHYILKPCNEGQIVECVKSCIEDACRMHIARQLRGEQFLSLSNILHNVLSSIINEEVCQDASFDAIADKYEQYLDFHFTSYRLSYIYYLDFPSLDSFLEKLRLLQEKYMPQTIIYGCYVQYTLTIFFPNTSTGSDDFEAALLALSNTGEFSRSEIHSCVYTCLRELLEETTEKLKRFSNIYYINNFHAVYICNYHSVMRQLEKMYQELLAGHEQNLQKMTELMASIENPEFLKQLCGSLFLKLASDSPSLSTYELTQWLIEIQKEKDSGNLKNLITGKIEELTSLNQKSTGLSSMTRQIHNYVEQNLQNPDLTLKYIAESHLFMNVDYVSRKFYKETGEKFSHYLTCARIKKSKEFLLSDQDMTIQDIAVAVGFGNNPRYFSQIFKKEEGMTPSEFILSCKSEKTATH